MARCRCGSTGAQNEYQAWLEALPENMADGATAEALRAICDLDLSELQSIVPPKVLGATEVSHDVIYEELALRLVIDDQN